MHTTKDKSLKITIHCICVIPPNMGNSMIPEKTTLR